MKCSFPDDIVQDFGYSERLLPDVRAIINMTTPPNLGLYLIQGQFQTSSGPEIRYAVYVVTFQR